MRFIQKTPLPESLATQFAAKQSTLDASGTGGWNPSKEQKKRLGQHLLPIQKHICCYCEKQFDNNPHHIEHFIEQHDDKTKTYDIHNITGAGCIFTSYQYCHVFATTTFSATCMSL